MSYLDYYTDDLVPRITSNNPKDNTVQHWHLYFGKVFVADTSVFMHAILWGMALRIDVPAEVTND